MSNSKGLLHSPVVQITFRVWLVVYRSIFSVLRGPVDLGTRLFLAQAFVTTSVMTMSSPEPPTAFGAMSVGAMVASGGLGGVFLSLGLFTRISAAALLGLVWTQSGGDPVRLDVFVVALLVWYVLRGPDALSVDRALSLGIRASALPLSRPVMRALDSLRDVAAPFGLAIGRVWLAAALVGRANLPAWIPVEAFNALPRGLATMAALLLLPGLGLPVVLTLLTVGLAGMHAMTSEADSNFYLLLFLVVLGFHNGGALTLDRRISSWLHARFLFDRPRDKVPEHWPHVVIVGAGFGGLACAAKLRALPVRVTMIDRHNYHLFQPLLYQVATAGLSPADVATPIRGLFREDHNISVRQGTVTAVDTAARRVHVGEDALGYDYLVLACGAAHSYFGRDDWAAFAPGLKRIEDGVATRSDVLKAFERAESSLDPVERERLLTFVVIGGGPTGVELAGAIAELAHVGLSDHYRAIDPSTARIVLVHAGDRILPSFAEMLSAKAKSSLEQLGVEVRLNARVTGIDETGVYMGGERIGAATVLWAAGVVASPAAEWLGVERDRAGRIIVGENLEVAGYPEIFAIGDTALSRGWRGNAVPGLAPAAKQGGIHVAGVIQARLKKAPALGPFRYRHMGSLATIGRKSAVADFGFTQLSGALAWWLWGAIHVAFLVGVRNRISVILNWLWCYLSFRLSVQLITGELVDTPGRDRAMM